MKRRLITRWILLAIIAFLCAALVYFIVFRRVSENDLRFATVDVGELQVTLDGTGVVVPAVEEAVVTPITSRILQVNHYQGDPVKKGDPLIQLDLASTRGQLNRLKDQLQMRIFEREQLEAQSASLISNMQMQLKVMEMQIGQRKAELANAKRLDSIGGGSAGKVREVEIGLKVAELEQEQLKLKIANQRRISRAQYNIKSLEVEIATRNADEMGKILREAMILAPCDGVLTFINTQVGVQVGAGTKLAVVSDFSRLRIDGAVDDALATLVSEGEPVEITITDETYKGSVITISPIAQNGVLALDVQFNDTATRNVHVGQKATLQIETAKRGAVLRIPRGAFYSKRGEYFLYVQQGRSLKRRQVILGDANAKYVEVISGLSVGDRVVIDGVNAMGREVVPLR